MRLIDKGCYYELWLKRESEKYFIFDSENLLLLKKEIKEISTIKSLVVIAPTGIAGANIKEMAQMTKKQAFKYSELGVSLVKSVIEYPGLTFFVSDKYLLGGGLEFALSFDFRIVSKSVRYGFPEVTLGITPGFGGIELAVVKGNSNARELFLLGKMYHAEYNQFDLFQYIEEDFKRSYDKTLELIETTKKASYKAIIEAKKELLGYYKIDLSNVPHIFSEQFEEHDQIEGMRAFIENRKANFENEKFCN